MKKWLTTALCLIFLVQICTSLALAAQMTAVKASIDSGKKVTVSGSVSTGAGQTVTVAVYDPNGKIDFVNNTSSDTWGNFSFSYLMTNNTAGTYAVKLSTPGLSGTAASTFSYGTNNDLSNLMISTGSLDKAFSPSVTTYSVAVDSSVASVTVTPTVSDSTASVTVNGLAAVSGTATAPITLNPGTNTITVAVTALTGKIKTYNVSVTKQAVTGTVLSATAAVSADSVVSINGTTAAGAGKRITVYIKDPKGNTEYIGDTVSSSGGNFTFTYTLTNVMTGRYAASLGTLGAAQTLTLTFDNTKGLDLSALSIGGSALSPVFQPSVTVYSASVPGSASIAAVVPTADTGCGSIAVNGIQAASGSPTSVTLQAGNTTISVTAYSQDGLLSKTYTVTINRTVQPASPVTASINTGKLVTVTGTAGSSAGKTITVMIVDPRARTEYVASTVTMAGGSFLFSYTMTNSTYGKYLVYVGANILTKPLTTFFYYDPIADLKNLTVNGAALSPDFSAGQTSYTATVPYGMSSVIVTPTAQEAGAAVQVSGTSVISGATSGSIALYYGDNTIPVVVTSPDGTNQKTYTITITRQLPPYIPPTPPSSAKLSGLTISPGQLNFDPDQLTYNIPYDQAMGNGLNVTPTAADGSAVITVNGAAVSSGQSATIYIGQSFTNPIEIVVTNGTKKETYDIFIVF